MPESAMQTAVNTAQADTSAVRRRGQADQHLMVRSGDLLQGRNSVVIEHNGAAYRLQTTRQGKLILTK